MEYKWVAFEARHFGMLTPQPEQEAEHAVVVRTLEPHLQLVEAQKKTWTLMLGDEVHAYGGYESSWPGRATLWMILDRRLESRGLLALTRCIQIIIDVLHANGFRRIETTARTDWPQANRWPPLLGFEAECEMKRYDPEGRTHTLYAMVTK